MQARRKKEKKKKNLIFVQTHNDEAIMEARYKHSSLLFYQTKMFSNNIIRYIKI
jgi:hypothetical protein